MEICGYFWIGRPHSGVGKISKIALFCRFLLHKKLVIHKYALLRGSTVLWIHLIDAVTILISKDVYITIEVIPKKIAAVKRLQQKHLVRSDILMDYTAFRLQKMHSSIQGLATEVKSSSFFFRRHDNNCCFLSLHVIAASRTAFCLII